MVDLPKNAFKKGIRDPLGALLYVKDESIRVIETQISKQGYSLYDHEWDCAIILDACRYDLASQSRVATSAFGDPSRVYSLGANSKRWLSRTFERASAEQRQSTHYVTANIFSEEAVPSDVTCTELWKSHFVEEQSTVPPRAVTDAAVQIGRTESPERLLVHYMQPHLPPVNQHLNIELDLDFREGWGTDNPWRAIEKGAIDSSIVESAYRNNLEPVVEDVTLLLKNLSAEKVLITADHGNMLGELGRWGHFRANASHPAVRMVPLWKTSANDNGTYEPNTEFESVDENISREDKLRALGYL